MNYTANPLRTPFDLQIAMNRYTISIVYLLMVVAIVYGMFTARRTVVTEFGSDQAQQQWQSWREKAAADADRDGPVQRRVNDSAEPPALILMRDYFGVCLAFAVAMSSMLYGALALMIVGAIAKPTAVDSDAIE